MKKRVLKFISKFFNKPIVQVGFYLLGILLIFFISGVFEDTKTSWDKIVDILSAQETISVFLAGLLSLGMARFLKRCDYYLEESLKIDDDHHKIIAKYSGHDIQHLPNEKENYIDKVGSFMQLSMVESVSGKGPENSEKDDFSKLHQLQDEQIKKYKEKKLYLPSVTVVANTEGNIRPEFSDRYEFHVLPDYVIAHADALLYAHKNSQKNNNKTIRLNDFTCDGNTLTLDTMRSTYYHMLMTNRCMDYDFSNGLTIRDLYEYDQRISPLNQSKLGNQIGINGLVLSNDGYALIEKRGHKKTTWKNKFAQSISLALKEKDLKLGSDRIIGNTYEDAQTAFFGVLQETLKKNFLLDLEKDCEPFSLEKNFLGIARDLLEGGKPNLYFYVVVDKTAQQLSDFLIQKASLKEGEDLIKTDKLNSDFYLVPFSELTISYQYVMNLDRRKVYKIFRKVAPRTKKMIAWWEQTKHKMALRFCPFLKRECGEALLATISFLELCKDRIKPIREQMEIVQRKRETK